MLKFDSELIKKVVVTLCENAAISLSEVVTICTNKLLQHASPSCHKMSKPTEMKVSNHCYSWSCEQTLIVSEVGTLGKDS